jgi:hypothetical protein
MKRRLSILTLVTLFSLATVGSALAAKPPPGQQGPNPAPPKCVPANTPGCS